ncbi:response regulator [Zooshikella marina]|uniref:response regulator n=1 Tax=Zooshikella ganghwensis TaxID=202772 RepID=UPI001BAF2EC4|nr:response regulator [Zooshikella ganghwensis]MBU2708207.1 response regulator [Zooshikella ganghwensis]
MYSEIKTVLHVDDQEMMRDLVEFGFEDTGVKFVSASSFDECVNRLKSLKPDVILLDALLGDMDGVDLADKISAQYKGLQVIFISALDEKTIFTKGKPNNVLGVISKPFIPKKLPSQVAQLLNQEIHNTGCRLHNKNLTLENNRLSELKLKYQQHLKDSVIRDIEYLWSNLQSKKNDEKILDKLVLELHKVSGTAGIHNLTTISKTAALLENKFRDFKNNTSMANLIDEGNELYCSLKNKINQL